MKKEIIKNTLIVNLAGGSGAGKSTTAYFLMAWLKSKGIDCEYVEEYLKGMVWEERQEVFKCQPYIFGKQIYKLFRVNNKVDVIVTDRPILLDIIYDPEQDPDFRKYVLKKFNQFNNINFYINRTKKFNPNGRNEKDVSEAKKFDNAVLKLFKDEKIKYTVADGDDKGAKKMFDIILKELNKLNAEVK